MISESSSDEVTAALATSDIDEYGTVICTVVVIVLVVVVLAVAAAAASCSWVARKASASSPAELERGRLALIVLDEWPISVTEPSTCWFPELWLELRAKARRCLTFPIPLPPIIEPTVPSVTEEGEIPSMALAASRRSSRFVYDVLLFLLLVLQVTSLLLSCWLVAVAAPTPAGGTIEYAAFAISMIDGLSLLPFASDGRDTANMFVVVSGDYVVLLQSLYC